MDQPCYICGHDAPQTRVTVLGIPLLHCDKCGADSVDIEPLMDRQVEAIALRTRGPYVARIIGPAGTESYLGDGVETTFAAADRFETVEDAQDAGRCYAQDKGLIADVVDTLDPEARVTV